MAELYFSVCAGFLYVAGCFWFGNIRLGLRTFCVPSFAYLANANQ